MPFKDCACVCVQCVYMSLTCVCVLVSSFPGSFAQTPPMNLSLMTDSSISDSSTIMANITTLCEPSAGLKYSLF